MPSPRFAALNRRLADAMVLSFTLTLPLIGQSTVKPLVLTPDLRIDGSAQDLSAITFLLVGRHGEIVVGQRDDNRLQYFDSTGKGLGKFGRAGEGPGEFRYVMRGGWKGDSAWVFDGALRRVTLISPARQLARTLLVPTSLRLRINAEAAAAPVSGVTVTGMTDKGDLLTLAVGQDAERKFVGMLARTDSAGAGARVVAILNRQSEEGCAITANGRRFDLPSEYCFRMSHGVSPDGRQVVTLTVAPGKPPTASIRLVTLRIAGDTVLDKIISMPAIAIDRKLYDRIIDTAFAHFAKNSPLLEAALRSQMRTPRYFPAASGLLLGGDGTIWVRRRTLMTQLWLGFDGQGKYFGQFDLPLANKPAAINRSTVYVVEPDADGLESVIRYRIGSGH
jgi:hypothetical protein